MFIPKGKRPSSLGYDAIIVGSGPAGISVALRLAALRKRSLILESEWGGEDFHPSIGYGHFSGDYWNGHAIRAFGGTSKAWNGWVVPLRAIDFNHPTVGVRWPITLDDLIPYYRRAAPILDRNPAIADFVGRTVLPGWVYSPFSRSDPTRFDDKYTGLFEASPLSDVALGYSVVGFEANAGRSTITTLHCFDHTTRAPFDLTIAAGQSVVIACGGIGNASLLLQPRADGSVPIGNESGLVGKFLMEHPHLYGAVACVFADDMDRYAPPRRYGRAINAIVPDAALETERQLIGCSLDLFAKDQDHPLVPLFSRPGVPAYRYSIDVRSEMWPTAANHVFLTGEPSRSGLFRPAARCVLSAQDLTNIDDTLRLFGEALIANGAGRIRIDNDELYREVRGGGHILGTTRMGTSRRDSVADARCRVHGYDNFYLAGSSLFPTGGYANPTFTIVALAVRLAEEIANRG